MRFVIVFFLIFISCNENDKTKSKNSSEKNKLSYFDSVKVAAYWIKAGRLAPHEQARQKYLDSALMIAPDSAFFWQQKAMPLYKARKYSLGKPFLAKAVEHNPAAYLEYSAFMKCIFSKEYEESIEEFMLVKEKYGDSYVMDHTHNFYLGLNYLQLEQFEKAKEFLTKSKEQQLTDFPKRLPEHACHHLDWFYLGVADFELGNYKAAIESFDMSLKVYENFADALYFKSLSLHKMGQKEEASTLLAIAFENSENTINEDQVYYEIYPYQVFHRLSPISRPK